MLGQRAEREGKGAAATRPPANGEAPRNPLGCRVRTGDGVAGH